MIGDWCEKTGRIISPLRLTNNPVEGYFHHLKVIISSFTILLSCFLFQNNHFQHHICQSTIQSCSELSLKLWNFLKAKHKLMFAENSPANLKIQKQPSEKFKKRRNRKRSKQGFYTSAYNIHPIDQNNNQITCLISLNLEGLHFNEINVLKDFILFI